MDSDTLYDLLYDLLGDLRIRDHVYEAIDMIEIFGWEDDSTSDFIPKRKIQYIKWKNIRKNNQSFFDSTKDKFKNNKDEPQDP